MQEKTKQRIIGTLVIIGALFIILPFLFHNERPSAKQAQSDSVESPATPALATNLPADQSVQQSATPVAPTASAVPVQAPSPASPSSTSLAAQTQQPIAQPVVQATAQQPIQPTQPSQPVVAASTPAPAQTPSSPASNSAAQFNESPSAVTTGQVNEAPTQPTQPIPAQQPVPVTQSLNQDPEIKNMQNTVQKTASIPLNATQNPVVAAAPMSAPIKTAERTVEKPVKKHIVAKHHAKHHATQLAKGKWSIQVGVFSEKENAMRLASKLREHHFAVFVHHVKEGHKTLFAVSVGPEANAHQAEMAERHLRAELRIKGIVKTA